MEERNQRQKCCATAVATLSSTETRSATGSVRDEKNVLLGIGSNPRLKVASSGRGQFSSLALFLTVIILVNMCPFQRPPKSGLEAEVATTTRTPIGLGDHLSSFTGGGNFSTMRSRLESTSSNLLGQLEACLEFARLMFKSPLRLSQRTTRFTLAEARVLGKMAKVWYIKKKIKKLSKKLKKHTIAVPVFTAIPIYEHSY